MTFPATPCEPLECEPGLRDAVREYIAADPRDPEPALLGPLADFRALRGQARQASVMTRQVQSWTVMSDGNDRVTVFTGALHDASGRSSTWARRWTLHNGAWRCTDIQSHGSWTSTRACPHADVFVASDRGFTARADWHVVTPEREWLLRVEVYAEPGSEHWIAGRVVADGATEILWLRQGGSPVRSLMLAVETQRRLRRVSTRVTLRPRMEPSHPRLGWCSALP